jgi:nitrate/nitrite-specific signal transduction histidine kinase
MARSLIGENEGLRKRIEELEASLANREPGDGGELPRQLNNVIEILSSDKETVSSALQVAEEKNRRLAARFVEVEAANNTLGNLYVATQQLHSTLDQSMLLRTLLEVTINLVGAEKLAIYLLDSKDGKLKPVAVEGAELDWFPELELGRGLIGESIATSKTRVVEASRSDDPAKPIICIPFRCKQEPVGAIAIYRLLQQKPCLTSLDDELFQLLAGHAGTAIYAAQLYSDSKRKLDTLQGCVKLVRPAPRKPNQKF